MCPGCSCDLAELATEYCAAMAHSRAIALWAIGEFGELATIISSCRDAEVRLALVARVDGLSARLETALAAPPSAARH